MSVEYQKASVWVFRTNLTPWPMKCLEYPKFKTPVKFALLLSFFDVNFLTFHACFMQNQ